jgi:translocation and assembly module TamA
LAGGRHWLAFAVALVAAAGARATVKVDLEGVDGDERKNVEAFLTIYRERDEKDLGEDRVQRLHERAPDEIREALSPFGRYRVQVEGDLAPEPDGSWRARYRIDPGPPVAIGTVDVRIVGEGGAASDVPKVDLVPGQPFTHAAWEAAKTSLKRYAREHGYLDARFTEAGVEVDPEANRADVRLHLDTGPRFYFGDIRFSQGEGTDFDPAFLQRFVDVTPGTPFSDEALLGLQGALMNTDYFSQVEVQPRLDEVADQRLPVEVRLEPNPPNRYRIGLGYATDTGVRAIFDWTRRYIGREGHSADVALLLSQAIQRLEASYRIPLGDPRREYGSLRASIEHYDTDARKGSVATVRADHHVFTGEWQRILAVDYEYEKPQDATETDSASEYYNLIPNATWIWKRLDNPLHTREGARVDFKVLGAWEGLLSSSSFLQGYVRGKAVTSPAEEWRLIARGEVGATLADSVYDIPPSRRFYAGGDNSVRGWGYEQLSPVDAAGKETGGRNLLTASLEVERHVTGKWWVAAFVDAGNAFDEWSDPGIVSSVGLGVRWLTPVGPLRVDIGVPLDDAPDSFRLHVVFGPDL